MKPLAILSAPGSRGDVNPMVSIGAELRQRGFDVVISISEPYAHLATEAGLAAEVVISNDQFDQMLGDPLVWRTVSGVRRVLTAMSQQFLPAHHDVIQRHKGDRRVILVAHPLDLASRVVRDAERTIPMASIHLQPVVMRMPKTPVKLTPWWFEPSGPAWLIRTMLWFADHIGLDPVIRPTVNQLRSQHGLPPIRRVLDKWWMSPDRVIALYPEWFAPETTAACGNLFHAGFPLRDVDASELVPPTDRPIVFTPGTAHQHSRRYFEHAVKVAAEIKHAAILLSSHAENIPDNLPDGVRSMSYVSLEKLLPHCRCIVHHGGVGTTSQALNAGIPQLIRPNAFDQFDNATRIEKLGCGKWLRRDRQLNDDLQFVCNDLAIQEACASQSQILQAEPNSIARAADELERLIKHHE